MPSRNDLVWITVDLFRFLDWNFWGKLGPPQTVINYFFRCSQPTLCPPPLPYFSPTCKMDKKSKKICCTKIAFNFSKKKKILKPGQNFYLPVYLSVFFFLRLVNFLYINSCTKYFYLSFSFNLESFISPLFFLFFLI